MKKTLVVLVIIACSDLLINAAYAQEDFAFLKKNVNTSAKNLFHDLSKTKDTLILSGDKNIRKVYSINTLYKRETDLLINANSVKLSLNHLSKGRHVFVVEQMPLKIVFVINVLQGKEFDTDIDIAELTASRGDN